MQRRFETREDQPSRTADLMIILDSTGSMGKYHRALRESLADVIRTFEQYRISVRFGLTMFRDLVSKTHYDKGHSALHVFPMRQISEQGNRNLMGLVYSWNLNLKLVSENSNIPTFTDDVDAAASIISQLRPRGGGGNPTESSYDALALSINNVDWTPGSERVVLLFTDQPPNIPDYFIKSEDELINQISRKIDQIHIFSISPQSYRGLARLRKQNNSPILPNHWPLQEAAAGDEMRKLLDSFARTTSQTIDNSNKNQKDEVETVDIDFVGPTDEDEDEDYNPFID